MWLLADDLEFKDDIHHICGTSGRDYHHVYTDQTIARLGIGRFLGDIMQNTQKIESKPKFFLFAGHDNTLGPLLNALEVCLPIDEAAKFDR